MANEPLPTAYAVDISLTDEALEQVSGGAEPASCPTCYNLLSNKTYHPTGQVCL